MKYSLIIGIHLVSTVVVFNALGRFESLGLGRQRIVQALVVAAYAAIVLFEIKSFVLIDIMVLLTAAAIGSAIGSFVNTKNALFVFCATAGLVDIYSFYNGLTHAVATNFRQGKDQILLYLGISFPADGETIFLVGIGDWIIVAGISYALVRMNYDKSFAYMVPWAGLMLALIVGLMVGGVFAIPFISIVTIIAVMYKRPPANTVK